MADRDSTRAGLEIAHVLFIDIAGYSKLPTQDQHRAVDTLNEIVRASAEFQQADGAGSLMKIPTGDGMALVFYTSPQAPARCAVEVNRALRQNPLLQVRMGVHSGSVRGITDVSGRPNLAGAALNIAQRVMDCGDAGHILLSKHAADDLAEYEEWRAHLHVLGECEVKHGVRIQVANLWNGDFGNRAIPTRLRAQRARVRKKWWIGAALTAAVVLVGALFVFGWRTGGRVENAIAVLPFRPLLSDNRNEVLEMGMADTLISKLSNTREIVVPSLTSVRAYAGPDQDPVAAGRALGVGSVLEGSVQQVADRIRVVVRLIKVSDGSSLWGETFEDKFSDVFDVQDKIAQRIVQALTLRLSGQGRQRLVKHYTDNVEAYQLYLTGRNHWNKLIPPEIAKSIEFFQKAVELDPNYALAHYGIAEAYRALVITSDMPAKELFPQAKAAAQKALVIDNSLAEPHATLALVHLWFDWDWAAAEREGQKAISLNPTSGFCYWAYAHVLSNLGRHQQAIAAGVRARELDPLSLIAGAREGAVFLFAGQYDQAKESLDRTLTIDPKFWVAHIFLGYVHLQQGQLDLAMAEFEKAKEFSRGASEAIGMIGYVAGRKNDVARAQAVANELRELSERRYVPPYCVSLVYLGLGDDDQALALLEKAYQERDVRLSFLKVYPVWDPLRSDPRFIALLKRIGLE